MRAAGQTAGPRPGGRGPDAAEEENGGGGSLPSSHFPLARIGRAGLGRKTPISTGINGKWVCDTPPLSVSHQRGKAAPNPLLPVIDRAHRSLQVALEELLRPAPWALAPTPAPVADGAQAEPAHPWLRHPDETARAYAAFRYYRDLAAQRTAEKVRYKFGLSQRLVERWSSAHAWVRRALAWDDHQDRIAVALSTDAIQTMRLEQADCGRILQVSALETLDARMTSWRECGSAGEPPFTAFEAARLIRIGSYLEQTGPRPGARGPGRAGRQGPPRVGHADRGHLDRTAC